MQNIVGRLIGILFVGAFCVVGPALLVIALATAANRIALVMGGQSTEGTVIAKRPSPGRSHPTFAPVFRFSGSDGQVYTVISDVSGSESDFKFGQPVWVVYRPSDPRAARIDSFGQLWTEPLVFGVVGAVFSLIPAFGLVNFLRRRRMLAAGLDPTEANDSSGSDNHRVRAALGVLLIAGGGALLALGVVGVTSSDASTLNESRVMGSLLGILLISSGVLIGQWLPLGGRRQGFLGGTAISSMALMFGWVALYGEASRFSGSVGVGGASVGLSGHLTLARAAFGVGSILCVLASLPAWKQVFRPTLRR